MSNDVSGTITQANSAQEVISLRQAASGYCVQNLDASENLWVNDEGPASAGPGSVLIPPLALYETPPAWKSQAVFEAVSAFSAKAGHAFTARRW